MATIKKSAAQVAAKREIGKLQRRIKRTAATNDKRRVRIAQLGKKL